MRVKGFTSMNVSGAVNRRAQAGLVLVVNCLCIVASSFWDTHPAYAFGACSGISQSETLSIAAPQAAQEFRVARDLIARGSWSEAVARLTQFIDAYTGDPNYDAALYWIAFALQKQNKPEAADRILQRLIKERPDSIWVKDAREMRIEIAAQLGKRDLIDEEAAGADDDIKLAALQSLFSADEKAAISEAAGILTNRAAGLHLKAGVLLLLADVGGDKMSDLLVDIVRNEKDPQLRMGAMRALRGSQEDRVLSLLRDSAQEAEEVEIGRVAVKSLLAKLAARPYLGEVARKAKRIEVRQEAIKQLAHNFPLYGIRDFVAIYASEETPEIKAYLIDSLANIGSHTNQSLEAEAMESLSRIYSAEHDDEFKAKIIRAFGRSTQKAALRKLIDIARSDPSENAREQAAETLAASKDPEAIRFAESIRKEKQL